MCSLIKFVQENSNIVKRGKEYIKGFIQAFGAFDREYINRKLLSLKDLSQESQYLQGLSEVLLYKFFIEQGYNPKTDVKVNGTDKDVDFVLRRDGVRINIEVKCPVIHEDDPDTLHISTGHRYSNDKKIHNQIFNPVIKEFIKNFNNNPNKTYKKIECEKLDDNKLKDYLESAQSKFAISKNGECNVLVLALTTSDFIRFFDYITNSQTGIFSENSYINPTLFDKVDCIILTNIISGHFKYKIDIDIWDVKEYMTFVLPNLNKHKDKNIVIGNESEKALVELFGNRVGDFKKFEDEFNRLNPGFPYAIQLTLPTYIARDFLVFSKEYKKENVILLE